MQAHAEEVNVRFSKGDLGVSSKATSWQPAPWAWVKKKFGPDRLRIKVRPAKGGDWLKELNQEFTGLDARAAENYARRLIEEGTSDAVWVEKEVYLDGYYRNRERHEWMVVESQRFELAQIERNPMATKIPPITSPIYQKRVKVPRHNGLQSVVGPLGAVEGGRLLRQRLPNWSKADHRRAASHHASLGAQKEQAWGRLLDEAHMKTFGVKRTFVDYKISGIGRSEYPESYKNRLRKLAHQSSEHGNAAMAHLKAAAGYRSKKSPVANPYYSGVRIAGNPAKISVYETGGVWFASHPTLGTIRFGQVGSLYPPRTWVEAKKYASARWGKDPWPIEYLPGVVGNPDKFYVSTYCNFAHRMKDGKPINHECIIFPKGFLEAERAGDYEKANQILSSARKAGKVRSMRRGLKSNPAFGSTLKFRTGELYDTPFGTAVVVRGQKKSKQGGYYSSALLRIFSPTAASTKLGWTRGMTFLAHPDDQTSPSPATWKKMKRAKWTKAPSVTAGGKPFFWTRPVEHANYTRIWVTWSRDRKTWLVTAARKGSKTEEVQLILSEAASPKAGMRWADKFFAGKMAANPLSTKRDEKSRAASGEGVWLKRVGTHRIQIRPDGNGYEWTVWRKLPDGRAEVRAGGWVPFAKRGQQKAYKEAKKDGLAALRKARVDRRSLAQKLSETDYRAKHSNPAKKRGKKSPYKPVLAPKGGRWAWIRVYPRSLKKAPAFRRTLDDAGITGVQLRTTAYGAKDEIVSVRASDKRRVKEALHWFRKHELGIPRDAEKHIFVLPKK